MLEEIKINLAAIEIAYGRAEKLVDWLNGPYEIRFADTAYISLDKLNR